jgi:hypothetical protein
MNHWKELHTTEGDQCYHIERCNDARKPGETSDFDALKLCLQNLMMFVYKHIPNVRQVVDQGT